MEAEELKKTAEYLARSYLNLAQQIQAGSDTDAGYVVCQGRRDTAIELCRHALKHGLLDGLPKIRQLESYHFGEDPHPGKRSPAWARDKNNFWLDVKSELEHKYSARFPDHYNNELSSAWNSARAAHLAAEAVGVTTIPSVSSFADPTTTAYALEAAAKALAADTALRVIKHRYHSEMEVVCCCILAKLICPDANPEHPAESASTANANRPSHEQLSNGKAEPGPKHSAEAEKPTEDDQCIFRKLSSGIWELKFEKELVQLPDSKGLQRIWMLLRSDERGISAAELMGVGVAGNIAKLPCDTGGQVADNEAVSAWEKRIKEIKVETGATKNPEQLELAKQILGYKQNKKHKRGMQGQPIDNAADAVRKSIKEALDNIQKTMPNLYVYLNERIDFGRTCYLRPIQEKWITDNMPT